MKILVFIVILSFVAIEKVSGRKCYACASTDSFEKCNDERKEFDCSTLFKGITDLSCVKLSYKVASTGLSYYERSCVPTSLCNKVEEICSKGASKVEDCKAYCCESDLCNKGAGIQLISGILLLTSVAFGLFGI